MEQDPQKRRELLSRPSDIQKHLEKIKNAADRPHFEMDKYQDFKLQIQADISVTPGNFKPSKIVSGQYYAHPQTIRALKKNIFAAADSFEDLEIPYQCESCKKNLDLQFWHFCPHCGQAFPF